jgi:hypothetical protein
LHISLGSLPTSSHNILMSPPSPICSAVFMLRGSMNGLMQVQRPCAVSKNILTPTSPRPLILFRALRTLVGEEPESDIRLLRSPSILESAPLQSEIVQSYALECDYRQIQTVNGLWLILTTRR